MFERLADRREMKSKSDSGFSKRRRRCGCEQIKHTKKNESSKCVFVVDEKTCEGESYLK